jgi:hypothetical protein
MAYKRAITIPVNIKAGTRIILDNNIPDNWESDFWECDICREENAVIQIMIDVYRRDGDAVAPITIYADLCKKDYNTISLKTLIDRTRHFTR